MEMELDSFLSKHFYFLEKIALLRFPPYSSFFQGNPHASTVFFLLNGGFTVGQAG